LIMKWLSDSTTRRPNMSGERIRARKCQYLGGIVGRRSSGNHRVMAGEGFVVVGVDSELFEPLLSVRGRQGIVGRAFWRQAAVGMRRAGRTCALSVRKQLGHKVGGVSVLAAPIAGLAADGRIAVTTPHNWPAN